MIEKSIKTIKSARYFRLGDYSEDTEELLFVLHGYGQLAGDFIMEFEYFADQKRIIIAPEGLNRFYLKGYDGRVGASWMTKEDRENEIEDYISYLNTLFDQEIKKMKGRRVNINILGFSQGASTAFRWIADRHVIPAKLILWAGSIPHFREETAEYLNETELIFVLGDKDEFFSKSMIDELFDRMNSLKLNYKYVPFGGGHAIDSRILANILQPPR